MDTSWIAEYMTTPYVAGGRELGVGLNCWGLIVCVYRDQLGIELPSYIIGDADLAAATVNGVTDCDMVLLGGGSGWSLVDDPKTFDMVMMTKSSTCHHVGLYLDIDGGCILHACEGIGGIVQRVSNIHPTTWKKLTYHRYEKN